MPDETAPRSPEERAADHAAIDRLADELLPALVAKLGATGLGEIEIREGGWRVRLRRPTDGVVATRRGADQRPSRAQPGHAGHGHAPGALEVHRSPVAGASGGSTNGSGRGERGSDGRRGDPHRATATSPAVGVFQPRPEVHSGLRVRAGDRLGSVDMLGVPLEVVAPADGIVGATLAEPGEAVEYGQELFVVELVSAPSAGASDAAGGRR
jgi:biotin carboxyl carrier protein